MFIFTFLGLLFLGLTAYVYIFYPLLLWLVTRFFRLDVDKRDYKPTVTLLIPTFNEEANIRRKIENSLALDYPADKLEILVIDDASEDATANIVREYERVKLIVKPARRGKMSSIEIGFAESTSEIVVLSDASPNYQADALHILMRSFYDSTVGAVVGDLGVWDAENAVAKPAGLYWKYEAAIRRWQSQIGSTVAAHGNMYAIRRTLYKPLAVGTINDEYSITMRVIQQGYRVVNEPDAKSYDVVSKKMQDEFRRRVRINAGRYQAFFGEQQLWPLNAPLVLFHIISHKLFRLLLPIFMLGGFIFSFIAVLLPDTPMVMNLVFAAQVAFYLLAVVGLLVERDKWYLKLPNIAYYITSSNVASLLGLWRFLTGRQTVLWKKN